MSTNALDHQADIAKGAGDARAADVAAMLRALIAGGTDVEATAERDEVRWRSMLKD